MLCIASCGRSKEERMLDTASEIMEVHPDSALTLLQSIDAHSLVKENERARYALLMSAVLDKNYIDVTTFDVLQPAIDYYEKHGTPDDKLRTLYYQGRIYQNAGNRDKALSSFSKALDIVPQCHDSLTIARMFVALGVLFYEFFDMDEYINCFLRASKIYKKLSYEEQEFDCLLNVLNGAVITENKLLSDSIVLECNTFINNDSGRRGRFNGYLLCYYLNFCSEEELKDFIDNRLQISELNINGLINLAGANTKIGRNEQAMELLEYVHQSNIEYDTLKYEAVLYKVLKNQGDYLNALNTYQDFTYRMESVNTLKTNHKSLIVKERHELELRAEKESKRRIKLFWSGISGLIFLLVIIIILLLVIRSNRIKKSLAIERALVNEVENDKLKVEKEKLSIEKQQLSLKSENLTYKIASLEDEIGNLKEIIEENKNIPKYVDKIIKERIEILNTLLAGYITDNEQYEITYEKWVKRLTNNTTEFMNSNRLAFKESHPQFIKYFEDCGLTEDEINYVCLYAIGLNGKEVGRYMKKPSHVNTSSAIRKKLGIDKHETNIGIYVRRLLKNN